VYLLFSRSLESYDIQAKKSTKQISDQFDDSLTEIDQSSKDSNSRNQSNSNLHTINSLSNQKIASLYLDEDESEQTSTLEIDTSEFITQKCLVLITQNLQITD